MAFYQITFKNGKTLEFATYEVANGYAIGFGLNKPIKITEE